MFNRIHRKHRAFLAVLMAENNPEKAEGVALDPCCFSLWSIRGRAACEAEVMVVVESKHLFTSDQIGKLEI